MSINFATLCKKLQLTPKYEQEAQLVKLKDWCYKYLTQDIIYEGSPQEQYDSYYSLAAHFLDNFLAHLPKKADMKMPTCDDCTPLQYATQQAYDRFISKQDFSVEDINKADAQGMTALHHSVTMGFLYTSRALKAKGANANKANEQNQLPIHCALFMPIIHEEGMIKRKEAIVRELLATNPEQLEKQDNEGNSILHLMAAEAFDEIMAEILQRNEKIAFLQNDNLQYPIHTAILNQQQKAIDALLAIKGVADLADGRKQVPLHYAARYGTATMVLSCCDATSDLNIRDSENKTPLLWAACAGNQEALETLIKKGADPKLCDFKGFSILHYAVIAANDSMVRWILEKEPSLLYQLENKKPDQLFGVNINDNAVVKEFLAPKGSERDDSERPATKR